MSKKSSKKVKKHLVIGAGEVGTSLYNVLKKRYPVSIRGKSLEIDGKFDVLHIAYPPVKNFIGITKKYIKKYKPKLVIIHSTIPVGTTRKVSNLAVHSPIRGMHTKVSHPGIIGSTHAYLKRVKGGTPSHFVKSIKIFVKYFAGPKAPEAAKIFSAIGIKTKIFKKPETTELFKILDTTYYGWNVIFAKEVKRLCDKFGLDFDEVYTIPNRDYNEGYEKLGKPNVVRPVLKPVPGKIGGHCIIPNCELLDDWLTQAVKKRNKKY